MAAFTTAFFRDPVNIERYRSAGFEPRDEITMVGGQVVTTMWRPIR